VGCQPRRPPARTPEEGYPRAVSTFLLLGCGYVAECVARRLLSDGATVHATSREPERLAPLARRGATVHHVEVRDERSWRCLGRLSAEARSDLRVLVSVPPLTDGAGATKRLLAALGGPPERVVQLSTTSVYGDASRVDERTAPAPRVEAGWSWIRAEEAAADGPWSALVLRCAAIYGPRRGLHVALREGRFGRVRDLDRLVSRVYVDDLAALAVAALRTDLRGAYPVADDEPATTRELVAHCLRLGLPSLPPGAVVGGTMSSGRAVDGRAVRRLLGVDFRHASYRTGLAAALAGERALEAGPLDEFDLGQR
jgi:nucleoside-diphosphate-sugar epimerase